MCSSCPSPPPAWPWTCSGWSWPAPSCSLTGCGLSPWRTWRSWRWAYTPTRRSAGCSRPPSALYSPRPASLSPTASGPTAMGGQQGPGWVEKLEPCWQLFVTYVVEATAGTEHNLAWWMAAVKAGNAYLPDLVTPLQRAQPMNAKMLVGAAAQYVQEVRQQGEGGWEVLLAMAGRMRKRFRSTASKILKSCGGEERRLMQALVAAGEARCLRLHQQLGAACNVTSQGNGDTAAETPPPDAANTPSQLQLQQLSLPREHQVQLGL
ncbi:hypothetical protein V8C86DRAFT_3141822 [Haematococcus lacustris]